MVTYRLQSAITAAAAVLAGAAGAAGHGFYQYSHGRADFANRYDLVGSPYPAPGGNPVIFDFGNFGAPAALPAGVSLAMLTNALERAGNKWEKWANVSFTGTLGANGTGLVRMTTDGADGAAVTGYGSGGNNFATLRLGNNCAPGVPWNKTNLRWTLTHELGHVLGLDDMYLVYNEEFVDHKHRTGGVIPQRPNHAIQDNIMDRYNNTHNYALDPTTCIDNDEISGVTWIWGGKYNQIITADLQTTWTNEARLVDPHHGDDPNNVLGWWDYRGSIVSAATNVKPYIDLEFPGYQTFIGTAYPAAPIVHVGNQGGNIERFEIQQPGWIGNFELWVKSQYTQETRVSATLVGGRTDHFDLRRNVNWRGFDGVNHWTNVYGPVPTPGASVLLGLSGLVAMRRSRAA